MKKRLISIALLTIIILSGISFLILYPKSPISLPNSSINACPDCNIIFITMTNLRYDHISSNGYFRPTTPNLDKLAAESLVFDNAFSHASWTLPESISIYTSLYPYQHGVMNRYDGSTLSEDIPTIVDILKNRGYQTAAFTGGFDYHTDFGLTSRFDEYQECIKGQLPTYPRQAGPRAGGPSLYGEFECSAVEAIDWLKIYKNNKFFVHIQGFDAHCPFSQEGGKIFDPDYKGDVDFSDCLWTFDRSVPVIKDGKSYYPVYFSKTGTQNQILLGEEDIKHLIAIYDEAIASADKQIGNLLNKIKQMGLWDKTIIVFSSEHGDMFGKQGRFMRGGPLRGTLYDDVIHIPLFIRIPGVQTKRIDGLVQHIDVFPTLMEYLGLNPPPKIEGKSLMPLIVQKGQVNDYVYAAAEFKPGANNLYFNKKTRVESIRNRDWKLIQEFVLEEKAEALSKELYDIKNDKEELINLSDKRKDILQSLESKLNQWSNRVKINSPK